MWVCKECGDESPYNTGRCACGGEQLFVEDEGGSSDEEVVVEVPRGRYKDHGIDVFVVSCEKFHTERYGEKTPTLATTWLDGFEAYVKTNRKTETQCDGCLELEPGKRIHAHNILSAVLLNYFTPQIVVTFGRFFYREAFELPSSLKITMNPSGPMRKVALSWVDWIPNMHQTRQTLEKLCVALLDEELDVQLLMLAKMRVMIWLEMEKAETTLIEKLPKNWDIYLPSISSVAPKKGVMNKPIMSMDNGFVTSVITINGDNAKRFGYALQCGTCEESQGEMALPHRFFFGEPGKRLSAYIAQSCYGNPFLLAMDLCSLALQDVWKALTIGDGKGSYGWLYAKPMASIKNWHLFMIYFTVCMFEGALGASPFRLKDNLVFKNKKAYYM